MMQRRSGLAPYPLRDSRSSVGGMEASFRRIERAGECGAVARRFEKEQRWEETGREGQESEESEEGADRTAMPGQERLRD